MANRKMQNVRVHDNGAAFIVMVDGLMVSAHNSLGGAWRHIQWMYEVASQQFTVGKSETPVRIWLTQMMKQGYLEQKKYCWMVEDEEDLTNC